MPTIVQPSCAPMRWFKRFRAFIIPDLPRGRLRFHIGADFEVYTGRPLFSSSPITEYTYRPHTDFRSYGRRDEDDY